jgi:hypothetical protein
MKAMWKMVVAASLVGGCAVDEPGQGELNETAQASGNPTPVFQSTWNGSGADTGFYDPATGASGSVSVHESGTKQQRAAFLSFYMQGPDPDSRECWIDWWGEEYCYFTGFTTVYGWGQIPSADFDVRPGGTEARLLTSTGPDFYVERCTWNWSTWYSDCTFGGSETFDLTWRRDGRASTFHSGMHHHTNGAYMFRNQGTYHARSATVAGSGAGHDFSGGQGWLQDTRSVSVSRGIYLAPPPGP